MRNDKDPSGINHFKLDARDQVKPCPFCGGTDVEMANTHTAYYWIECATCGAEHSGAASGGSSVSAHRAAARRTLEAWNTRATATHYAECSACFAEVAVDCDGGGL